jgi:hypothetical protein
MFCITDCRVTGALKSHFSDLKITRFRYSSYSSKYDLKKFLQKCISSAGFGCATPPSTQEAKTGGSKFRGHPGLHNEILSHKINK